MAQNLEMTPYFNLTKTNVTYYKCSNSDRGFPARLIVRNKEIPATYLSPEFFDTLILKKHLN
ncbi:hypothetical protein HZS_7420 [Henneguya salminicola]|nr:hypothetical protein HZS_7420 [Henneguya salminicola]